MYIERYWKLYASIVNSKKVLPKKARARRVKEIVELKILKMIFYLEYFSIEILQKHRK